MLWTGRRAKVGSRPFLGGDVLDIIGRRKPNIWLGRKSGERRAVVVLRVIGWLLIAAALLALGWDLFLWFHDGHFTPSPAGRLWYIVWPHSFNFVEHTISELISKSFWDSAVMAVLKQPMLFVAGIPGLLLALVARRRRRRRFSR